jgi:hypothetical protein
VPPDLLTGANRAVQSEAFTVGSRARTRRRPRPRNRCAGPRPTVHPVPRAPNRHNLGTVTPLENEDDDEYEDENLAPNANRQTPNAGRYPFTPVAKTVWK